MKSAIIKSISFFILVFNGYLANSQGVISPFSFDKQSYDFGEVFESGGVVSAKFHYANTGDKPLFISQVNVSCGCTEPVYSKDTLLPGENAVITARFDPTGRPGHFDKSIRVIFNNNPGFNINLRIHGEVISVAKPNKGRYSVLYGNTSMNTITFDFGEIKYENKEYVADIKVSNDGYNRINFIGIQDLPSIFHADYPQFLDPGDSAVISLKVNIADMSEYWGEFNFRLILLSNDYLMSSKVLYVKGRKTQDFSHLSKKERANAPVIKVESTSIKFDKIKLGGTATKTITITNKGKSNLQIRKIHNACFCFKGTTDKEVIAPGETATLTLTFDSIGQKLGKLYRGVTIYSNDPKNSEIIVYGETEIYQ
ncbi:MAG: DUF1573 domain-containing protein [Bacteroidetes bacterium]|nr:DUF1573 domain-containing protein [Bacteroidota bacterium]